MHIHIYLGFILDLWREVILLTKIVIGYTANYVQKIRSELGTEVLDKMNLGATVDHTMHGRIIHGVAHPV